MSGGPTDLLLLARSRSIVRHALSTMRPYVCRRFTDIQESRVEALMAYRTQFSDQEAGKDLPCPT